MSDEPAEVRQQALFFEAHVEGAGAIAALDEVHGRPIALLDSSEIIELSIKPSLWFVPIVAARTVLIALLIAGVVALAARTAGGWSSLHQSVVAIALLAAAARVVLASLQWASRLYILTNRRVMRFSGVLSVDVTECPLPRIGQACIKTAFYTRALNVGTIRMQAIDQRLPNVSWDHVARPGPIHEKLVRAIRRGQSGE